MQFYHLISFGRGLVARLARRSGDGARAIDQKAEHTGSLRRNDNCGTLVLQAVMNE
jgi:hypothetical protein